MKILCFGSANIDYVYSVPRFAAVGETIPSLSMQVNAGGKGLNQAIALARAGGKVFFAGKIGADGLFLREELQKEGIDTSLLQADDHLKTGHAVIQVDQSGQNTILLFGGANRAISERDVDIVLSRFSAGDVLLLQNELTNTAYIIRAAHEKGMHIAFNPSPMDEEIKEMRELIYVDWLILNEVEGHALTGVRGGEEICDHLRRKCPNTHIVLTLGRQGVIYCDREAFAKHGVYEVPVLDTTAAGDTLTGYFLIAVSEQRSVQDSLTFASKAASLVVTKPGASSSIPRRREVEETEIRLKAEFL